ncbi:MAG: GNAT family N-acetyltransferase [Pseudomonadota bacterium]
MSNTAPSSGSASASIRHNTAEQRFECTVDGHLCVAEYQRQGQVMRMTHTEVHASLRGRGIAAGLVGAALAHAQAQGLRVEPACSYVHAYLQRHPQTKTAPG